MQPLRQKAEHPHKGKRNQSWPPPANSRTGGRDWGPGKAVNTSAKEIPSPFHEPVYSKIALLAMWSIAACYISSEIGWIYPVMHLLSSGYGPYLLGKLQNILGNRERYMKKILTLLGLLALSGFLPVYALDLIQIYELGLQNDPQLQVVRAERDSVRESRPQALAQLRPTFSVSGDVTRTYSDVKSSSSSTTYSTYSAGKSISNKTLLSLNLNQPLYRKDYWIQLQQSDNQIAQAAANYETERQSLIMRIAQAYFNVLSAQDTLGFSHAEKKAILRQLEQAQQRFDVGLIAITSVHEAQAAYDKARADEIQAENELDDAWEALHEIIGDSEKRLAVLAADLPLSRPEPDSIDQWSDTALQQNPKLVALRSATTVARQNIELQRAGHYPTLTLVGSHALSRSDAERASDSDTSSIGLQLNVPLYLGGGTTSRTRQARFDFEKAQQNLDRERRAVKRQVRDAYRGVVSSISRVKALKATTVSAKSALEATEAGLEVGTRTMVDVLTEQRNLYRARRDYSFVRYDYILNGLRLKQAAGSLSRADLEKITPWLN